MMKRITITVDDELEEYLEEKSEEYGNRSRVVRRALERMKKREVVDDVREYFAKEDPDGDEEMADFGEGSWEDLPEY